MAKKKKITMIQIIENSFYQGKHVILIKNKVFTAKTGSKAERILKMVRKKYPNETPEVTYIPKANTLVLCA